MSLVLSKRTNFVYIMKYFWLSHLIIYNNNTKFWWYNWTISSTNKRALSILKINGGPWAPKFAHIAQEYTVCDKCWPLTSLPFQRHADVYPINTSFFFFSPFFPYFLLTPPSWTCSHLTLEPSPCAIGSSRCCPRVRFLLSLCLLLTLVWWFGPLRTLHWDPDPSTLQLHSDSELMGYCSSSQLL